MPAAASSAINNLLAALKEIEGDDAATVVASRAWAKVKDAANAVLASDR